MRALIGSVRLVLLTLLLTAALLTTGRTGGTGAAHAADPFDSPPAHALVDIHTGADDPAVVAGRNPVQTVPMERLAVTRTRPLFTPSRRPPSPPIKAPPPPVTPPAPAPASAQSRVTLIGTVVGMSEAYGIFRVEPTGTVMRLRTGESYNGWVLRSVRQRDAELEKDHGTELLVLFARGPGGGVVAPVGQPASTEQAPTTGRPSPPTGSRPPTEHVVLPHRPPPARLK